MKINRSVSLLSALLAGVFLISCGSTKTTVEKEQKALRIREDVASSHFTFNATTAYPMNYKPIHLTSSYELKISKDTVKAYLPYFGRAYVAPVDPSESGIKFTSTRFEYKAIQGKRQGSWAVTIKTFDTDRSFTLYLDIWDNGSGQLRVSDPNRQSISFEGEVKQ